MKKRVALIYGGEGAERDISKISAKNLLSLIDKSKYDVFPIEISASGNWKAVTEDGKYIGTFPIMLDGVSGFLLNGKILPVDCAIPCLHGDFGEDGTVQGALATAHVSYVGQDVYASGMTSDKAYAKLAASHLSIPTASWIISHGKDAKEAKAKAEARLNYPMFIKPARLGSSYGAIPVRSEADFESAYTFAKGFDKRLLIEELIRFDYEVECALFDVGERKISAGGRVLSNGKFYDFDSKYNSKRSPFTEAKSGAFPDIEKKIIRYTEQLADFIEIRHISRFDFFVTKDKRIFFNEINAFPGMTETSLYPKLTEDMGYRRGEFINLIIESLCGNDRSV